MVALRSGDVDCFATWKRKGGYCTGRIMQNDGAVLCCAPLKIAFHCVTVSSQVWYGRFLFLIKRDVMSFVLNFFQQG